MLYSEYNTSEVTPFEQEAWFTKFKPEKVEIEAITLDKLILDNNLNPAIIKIDVEGAEDKVIAGAENTLHQHSPYNGIFEFKSS